MFIHAAQPRRLPGVELTKAELALRLGQPYEQNKSLGQFFKK